MVMKKPELKIAVFEKGRELEKRKCPINGDTVKNCVGCPSCAIMSGFGGAGAFSDGKYNITNEFGGTLHEYIGKKKAMELMRYVDDINMSHGGEGTRMYSTGDTKFKKICIHSIKFITSVPFMLFILLSIMIRSNEESSRERNNSTTFIPSG